MDLLHELNAAGATIIVLTHDERLADQLPRQIRMLDGRVVSDAPPVVRASASTGGPRAP
jgi:putative ABC transport system ATP-binding protein